MASSKKKAERKRNWEIKPWSDEELAIFTIQWGFTPEQYYSLTGRQRAAILREAVYENS